MAVVSGLILLAAPGAARAEPVECSVSSGNMGATQEGARIRACVQPCDEGSPRACTALGFAVLYRPHLYGRTLVPVSERDKVTVAASYLARACQAAPRYRAYIGRDWKESTEAHEAAEVGRGCNILGQVYALGQDGFPQDWARATEHLGVACEFGIGIACDVVARSHIMGRGVPKNPDLAVRHGERGCNLDHGTRYRSCTYAAAGHVARDRLEKAIALLETACDLASSGYQSGGKAEEAEMTCAALDRTRSNLASRKPKPRPVRRRTSTPSYSSSYYDSGSYASSSSREPPESQGPFAIMTGAAIGLPLIGDDPPTAATADLALLLGGDLYKFELAGSYGIDEPNAYSGRFGLLMAMKRTPMYFRMALQGDFHDEGTITRWIFGFGVRTPLAGNVWGHGALETHYIDEEELSAYLVGLRFGVGWNF